MHDGVKISKKTVTVMLNSKGVNWKQNLKLIAIWPELDQVNLTCDLCEKVEKLTLYRKHFTGANQGIMS